MKIIWNGGSTIELRSGSSCVVLNPQGKELPTGTKALLFDRTQETLPEHGDILSVDWPGEYDIADFAFKALEVQTKKGSSLLYNFISPEGNVAWMGEMADYPTQESELEALGDVHALIIPVGGDDVLSAKTAYRLVEYLEPVVVIPICFGGKREGLEAFLKEMDVKLPEPLKHFDLKRSALSSDQMELVILKD